MKNFMLVAAALAAFVMLMATPDKALAQSPPQLGFVSSKQNARVVIRAPRTRRRRTFRDCAR